jgi:hypothetical protein
MNAYEWMLMCIVHAVGQNDANFTYFTVYSVEHPCYLVI